MIDSKIKQNAVRMLRRGLATYAEIAKLSGQSRQIVRHWGAEIKGGPREDLLQKEWNKGLK